MSRSEAAGDQRATAAKIASRYDPAAELEVLAWLKELADLELQPGMRNVELGLKNGQALVNLAIKVRDGTPECPEKAKKMRLKPNTLNAPFKQMENIQTFLTFSEAYGVPRTCTFQTVDLYEGRNMAQVLSGIQALGTEAQRYGCSGPKCGAEPSEKTRAGLSLEKIRASHGIIGGQAGSNKYASQTGMRAMGGVRHGSDIRADKSMDEKSATMSSQQLGSNQFASQKGQTAMGATRHGADIRADQFDPASASTTSLQLGSNQWASQKGMRSIGAVRHAGDIRADEVDKEGESCLPSQSGTNQYASQKGMRMIGGVRHGADISVEKGCDEGQGVTSGQLGSNQYASQKGMNCMGGVRHIGDIQCDIYDAASAGIMGMQAGDCGYATQSHMRIGGVRHGADLEVPNQTEYSQFYIPAQSGSNKYATQKGLRIGGVRHGADITSVDLYTEAMNQAQEFGWTD